MSGGSVTKIAKIVKKVLVTDWSISGEFEAGSESTGGLLFDLFVAVKLLITRVTLHPDASGRTSTTISSSNHTLMKELKLMDIVTWACEGYPMQPGIPKLHPPDSYQDLYAALQACVP
jgi:hypothetical protein